MPRLMREVEATVDRLVVISEGRLVREGPLEELTAVTGTRVAALDQAALRRALDAHGIAFELRAGGELAVSLAPEDMGRLALREQLVVAELLECVRLDSHGLDALDLERGPGRHLLSVLLRIQEGIRNRDRHLVPHLG